MAEASNLNFQGGYSKAYFFLNSLFNTSLSLVLSICALPFLITIALLLKLLNGGPVLYKGVRLGLNKAPFMMYKFRTLSPGAQKIIGAELLTEQLASSINVLTPFGRFLRETRLDELPQLFNIIRGDMDFLGPRPERPEIYERFCRQIRGYDKRFMVKPGLIGYSQLFTPHSSPKRLRTLIDNKFLAKKQKFLWDLFFILLTTFAVLGRIISFGSQFIWTGIVSRTVGRYDEKRKLARVKVEQATVHVSYTDSTHAEITGEAKLIDLNEDALLLYSGFPLDHRDLTLTMEIMLPSLHMRKNRRKTAICSGSLYKTIMLHNDEFTYAHVIKYSPVSALNSYMVHQYFLDRSII